MKISLITATYNSAATLKSTFKSVLSQTYTDIDYWVIDGGSTDGTIDIIKEYEAVFGGRMHYISEKDRGIYDAMNKGISRCTGDVVGILNSDDYFTSDDVLQNVAHTFSSNETIDAVYGDIHFISDNNPDKIGALLLFEDVPPVLAEIRFHASPSVVLCKAENLSGARRLLSRL